MSKTITAVGIEKIGRRLADSIDHAAYTLNGEPKTVEPFRRLVSADEVKIYVYFDDTVTGTVGDVQLVDRPRLRETTEQGAICGLQIQNT